MKLKCRIAGHSQASDVIYNSGFFFGRCGHCRADMIRTGKGGWQQVPDGHAVSWRTGDRHSHSLPADFTGLLPIAVSETRSRPKLPATQDRFLSWSRALVTKRPRRWSRGNKAAAAATPVHVDEVEEKHLPVLLVAALLVGASMRLLLRSRR